MVETTEDKQLETTDMTDDMTKAQLTCKICKAKRSLTEEEIQESIEIAKKHAMKPNGILSIWSALDGDVCPEGGNHDYAWNPAFREKIMNEADKRKNNDVVIIRNNNENKELNAEIAKIKKEVEQKIKEITEAPYKKVEELEDKIKKNQEAIIELEKLNPDLEENILKVSGREWKQWL